MIDPPRWTKQDFEADIVRSVERFRKERLEEPLEAYLELFDKYQEVFEELLESTTDLTRMLPAALDILPDERLLEAFRYLAGPPISLDDLKTVAEAKSFAKNRLQTEEGLAKRTIELVRMALDRRRFPWISDDREPTETEKAAAIVASAALLATQKASTSRRREGKQNQERTLEDALLRAGFQKVPTRQVKVLEQAPAQGQFCGESLLGERKADFIVRLWDRRIMPVECKVSNSAINSVKRLNNDAAAKAEAWRRDFGERQVVPTALLSGVYKIHNLLDAQGRGLTIFWAHDIKELIKWIEKTRP